MPAGGSKVLELLPPVPETFINSWRSQPPKGLKLQTFRVDIVSFLRYNKGVETGIGSRRGLNEGRPRHCRVF